MNADREEEVGYLTANILSPNTLNLK